MKLVPQMTLGWMALVCAAYCLMVWLLIWVTSQ